MEIIIEVDEKALKVSKFTIKTKSGVKVYKNGKAAKLARLYTADSPLFYLWYKYQ